MFVQVGTMNEFKMKNESKKCHPMGGGGRSNSLSCPYARETGLCLGYLWPESGFCFISGNRIRLITSADDIGGGRVEVYHNGQWGTICDKNWSDKAAEVVCKELGFRTALYASKKAFFGEGTGQVTEVILSVGQ